jgi:hypothetical protein
MESLSSPRVSGASLTTIGGATRPLAIVGLVLIILDIAGLALSRFSYATEEKVIDVGPLEATAEKEHSIAIPGVAGISAVLAGGFWCSSGAAAPRQAARR